MSDDILLKLQKAEFVAADALRVAIRDHEATPVVDDDYPRVRHLYERSVRGFLRALFANRGADYFRGLGPTVAPARRFRPSLLGRFGPSSPIWGVWDEVNFRFVCDNPKQPFSVSPENLTWCSDSLSGANIRANALEDLKRSLP